MTSISGRGFWLSVSGQERFLAFEQFPWFRDATVAQITNVRLVSPRHLNWPDLDIDLAVDSIEHPENFPLVSKERASPARPRRRSD